MSEAIAKKLTVAQQRSIENATLIAASKLLFQALEQLETPTSLVGLITAMIECKSSERMHFEMLMPVQTSSSFAFSVGVK